MKLDRWHFVFSQQGDVLCKEKNMPTVYTHMHAQISDPTGN